MREARVSSQGYFGGHLSSRLPWMTTSTLHGDEDFLAFVDVSEHVGRLRSACTLPWTSSDWSLMRCFLADRPGHELN